MKFPVTKFLVTVVVAVPRRPAGEQRFLLRRAIESVQRQTLQPLEIVVVLDGPNSSVCRELWKMDIPDLKIVMQEGTASGLKAWQMGIDAAQSPWIALLHDEDEWEPHKLSKQLQAAHGSPARLPVVSSRFRMMTQAGEEIWPRRLPEAGESIGDYLFRRSSGFLGEGLIQRSTLFFPRALAIAVPFQPPAIPPIPIIQSDPSPRAEAGRLSEGVPVLGNGVLGNRRSRGLFSRSDDDERSWLLRVAATPGAGICFVAQPCSISRWEGLNPARVHRSLDWQASLAWIQRHRHHLSDLAYQTFLLTEVAAIAAEAGDRRAFTRLLTEACQGRLPSPRQLFIYLSLWTIQPDQRQQIRTRVQPSRRSLVTTGRSLGQQVNGIA